MGEEEKIEERKDDLETYVPTGITVVKHSESDDVLVLEWNTRKLMSLNLLNDWWWKKFVIVEGGWKIVSLMEWDKNVIRIHLSRFTQHKTV